MKRVKVKELASCIYMLLRVEMFRVFQLAVHSIERKKPDTLQMIDHC